AVRHDANGAEAERPPERASDRAPARVEGRPGRTLRLPRQARAGLEPRLVSAGRLFDKVLIANRGEIACRIARTLRKLGIGSVAVYSEADAGAQHVRQADEAICIGGPRPQESYLRGEAIIAAALKTGAKAI